ncbi:BZ3500_MvSof-1268-A1-R1_Chr6-2g08526 [Microbotryum saponariae]|uniref:BZ3500_MvSof-1268-A1-R1_Chr6-2g08526 protein n=1 Tax=Microbotryum saponariae TaxID=289078 RepID=A0A2X0KHY3_9BASI|nr:BZ3500_MvSof-1268-A1-R1_Chr6-2g08526 [Microbotryum saponariae]SDA07803.1 BZ3501_MvSof-1269-A2-R1_Chr6-1g08240 [Microbotryum saponariae]
MSLLIRRAVTTTLPSCTCSTTILARRTTWLSSALHTSSSSSSTASSSTSTSANPSPSSTSPPPPPSRYALPKGLVLNGLVTQAGVAAQTTTVTVERQQTHHKTLKAFKTHKKYLIHDPLSQCVIGDRVEIRNCKPVSKRKRFELIKVLKASRQRESAAGVIAQQEREEGL